MRALSATARSCASNYPKTQAARFNRIGPFSFDCFAIMFFFSQRKHLDDTLLHMAVIVTCLIRKGGVGKSSLCAHWSFSSWQLKPSSQAESLGTKTKTARLTGLYFLVNPPSARKIKISWLTLCATDLAVIAPPMSSRNPHFRAVRLNTGDSRGSQEVRRWGGNHAGQALDGLESK